MTLPPALKCSKCDFVAGIRRELDEHWLLDH